MSEAEVDPYAGTLRYSTAALLAPVILGNQLFLVLYGIYLSKHCQYCLSPLYTKLPRGVKATLWLVCLLATVYAGISVADTTYWMATIDRTPSEIIHGIDLDAVVPLIAGLVAVPVQVLLGVRAAAMIRRNWLRKIFLSCLTVAIVLSFTGCVFMCAITVMYIDGTDYRLAPFQFNDALCMWLWAGAACDVAISTCLALTLNQQIQGFNQQTDGLLRWLIRLGMRTAAYTAVLATAGAILAIATRNAATELILVHWAFWVPLPACYALSLYTTLSARRTVDQYLSGSALTAGQKATTTSLGRRDECAARSNPSQQADRCTPASEQLLRVELCDPQRDSLSKSTEPSFEIPMSEREAEGALAQRADEAQRAQGGAAETLKQEKGEEYVTVQVQDERTGGGL